MKKKLNQPEQTSLWDLAENDDNRNRARVFERDWHEAYRLAGYRPAIDDYLPVESTQRLAALLALARVDMACRYDIRDRPRVEDYLHLIDADELTDEFVAGLAFEEFMLRQEQHEQPKAREYRARFPDAFGLFHELVQIQEALAGDENSEICSDISDKLENYPAPGEVIGNFELIDVLGSGSFAKVYLARDSAMGNREVALKVSLDNHLEWLTLARLQHTHIVPVYSHCRAMFEDREYDLICMPFYGSVTLKTLIDHEKWGLCFSGSDIQSLVRSIDHESLVKSHNEINLYDEMSGMSFAQAIAWWGACLAEAMHHAHQRRVLHRDIKPTNILITADGDPMLLDFNLAMQGPGAESAHQKMPNPLRQKNDSIGGTLAYMAPEHLEAMISGQSRLVDHRADIFSLGAVLYEALTRSDVIKKSHAPAENRAEMLQQALELRKIPAIPVRDIAPDVPYVLDKVIRKCIDPNPARRYTNAFELSEDLRAIARDLPLKNAGEPLTNRFRRIFRQNARTLIALSAMAILMFVGPGHSLYQNLEQNRIGRLVIDTQYDLNAAKDATENGNYQMAYVILRQVTDNLASESALAHLQTEAQNQLFLTSRTEQAERNAADFIKKASWQRYRIIHSTRFGGEMSGEESITQVKDLIEPVVKHLSEVAARNIDRKAPLSPENWVEYLNTNQISDMTRWMDILLFDAICSQFRSGNEPAIRLGKQNGEYAMTFTQPALPWTILNDRLSAVLERRKPAESNWPEPDTENSPVACIEFALLARLDGKPALAGRWLRQAVRLQPADPWIHHELALLHEFQSDFSQALIELEIANSLDTGNPWSRLDHARLERLSGQPSSAITELNNVRNLALDLQVPPKFFELIDLEEALVQQDLFEFKTAELLLTTIKSGTATEPSIREMAAQALCEQYLQERKYNAIEKLFREFAQGIDENSGWGLLKARYHLARNQLSSALNAITPFLQANPDVIRAREVKALILSRMELPVAAFQEMQEIVRLSDTPAHRRTLDGYRMNVLAQLPSTDSRWQSALISLHLDDPESVLILPAISRNKMVRVINLLNQFQRSEAFHRDEFKPHQARFYTNLAILQSEFEAGDWKKSISQSLAIQDSSISLLRSQIMLLVREKQLSEASALLRKGASLGLVEAQLSDVRGMILFAENKYADALNQFDEALRFKSSAQIRAWRALCLMSLKRWNEAQADLSIALASDPFHPEWRRLRAGIWQKMERKDFSQIDLFLASAEGQENLIVRSRLTIAAAMSFEATGNDQSKSSLNLSRIIRANWPEIFPLESEKETDAKTDRNIEKVGGN